ncbi:MAG: Smr/MutS family protein [Zoogloeaceae bacterium]|jgi:DNA-nicking Smr family endonuclease|nr:Smr/MutS family protein [Zoogloeaceae bacterium]
MGRRRARHPAFDALADLRGEQADAGSGSSRATKPSVRKNPPAVSAGEQRLFRAAMAGVTPLPATGKAEIATPKPRPVPRQRHLDERQALAESRDGMLSLEDRLVIDGEESVFLRSGISRRTLSDLRRGRWVIQAELDLHGLNREEAREALNDFLADALDRGWRCVRIIHGKGLSSPGGHSVLKTLSRQWLAQRAEILAFCHAKPHDGGEGALLALLRSSGER